MANSPELKGGQSDVSLSNIEETEGYHQSRLKRLYYRPFTQILMLGLICFLGPGLYNALNGLGGGGMLDPTTSANSNAALLATSAVTAFFAGSVTNKLGPRITLLMGTTGYSLYIGSFLALKIHPNLGPFVITCGAILGICAGFLWNAQGSLMLAYPTESEKGVYIGVFWAILNLGGVVGASVSLGKNIHSKGNEVGVGTYVGFLIMAIIGISLPLMLADPQKMFRSDGTKVATLRHKSWKQEVHGLWTTFKTDPSISLLFPMFFAANYFYTWQFNDYNAALFNIRARSLNNVVYWMSQIVGSVVIGLVLDQKYLSRRQRAFTGWTILFGLVWIVHIWAYFYQRNYTRATVAATKVRIDIYDKTYIPRVWLYIFCGILDAIWQTTAYWVMGTMSNDPAKLAHIVGFYKTLQCIGGAGAYAADGAKVPYMNMFLSTWAILAGSLIFAFPMLYLRVKNYTDVEVAATDIGATIDDSPKTA